MNTILSTQWLSFGTSLFSVVLVSPANPSCASKSPLSLSSELLDFTSSLLFLPFCFPLSLP